MCDECVGSDTEIVEKKRKEIMRQKCKRETEEIFFLFQRHQPAESVKDFAEA